MEEVTVNNTVTITNRNVNQEMLSLPVDKYSTINHI